MRSFRLALPRYRIEYVFVVLIIFFAVLVPSKFLTGLNVQNVARQVSFDALIALGETAVLIGGGLDLSVGSVLTMAAAFSVGLQPAGVPVACGAALLFGALTGVVNGFLVTRARVIPFIATLGTMTVVRGLVLTYTRQEPISGTVPWFSDFSNSNLGPVPVPTAVLIIVFLALHLILTRTRFGRNLYAAGGNREACKLAGIRADYYIFWSYVLCGTLAALSGVLLASRLNSATIHIGNDTPLLVLTGAVMGGASMAGGRGSAVGTILGMLTLAVLGNGMALLAVPTFYQTAIRALLLIVIVVLDASYALRLKQNVSARAVGAGNVAKGSPLKSAPK